MELDVGNVIERPSERFDAVDLPDGRKMDNRWIRAEGDLIIEVDFVAGHNR